MKTQTKLVALELMAGFFGWLWLIAAAGTAILVVNVIFLDGSWSLLGTTLGASLISKWIASGLHDNKLRIAYEAEMISQGMTAQEAGKAWVQAYLARGGASRSSQSTEDQAIVRDYAAYIEMHPPGADIRDLSCLRSSKERILDALVAEHNRERDQGRKGHYKALALTLASFQQGVGTEPLAPLGLDIGAIDATTLDLNDFAAAISNGQPEIMRSRWQEFRSKVDTDTEHILAKFNQDNDMRT